jgi:hypothetical protein
MKTVCSFCSCIISPGTSPGEPVSHGVCKSCYDMILARHGFNVRKFLDLLDTPVLLVDDDTRILEANSFALKIVNQPIEHIQGKLGGNILECINAFLPEGCGKTPFCSDCPIRISVNETYATGHAVTRRPAHLCRKIKDTKEHLHLLVSTRKAGNVVLLQLEPDGAV